MYLHIFFLICNINQSMCSELSTEVQVNIFRAYPIKLYTLILNSSSTLNSRHTTQYRPSDKRILISKSKQRRTHIYDGSLCNKSVSKYIKHRDIETEGKHWMLSVWFIHQFGIYGGSGMIRHFGEMHSAQEDTK